MSSGLLLKFLVLLGSLHETWKHVLYLIQGGVACSGSVNYNQAKVLNIPVLLLVCSQDWTSNLQMIVS